MPMTPMSSAARPMRATRASHFVPVKLIAKAMRRNASVIHGGDGHDHRPDVDPRRHPGVPPAPEAAGPGVDAAVDGVLRDDLAEHERDEELPGADDHDPPDRGR